MAQRPVLLDTDIGTDVDDILALALLAKAPELDLVGVATVYGDTPFRARIARFSLDKLGRNDVPVVAGAQKTLTDRPVWWAGHEGEGIPGLADIPAIEGAASDAFLHETARRHDDALEIAAIGPLTNIARAISGDPDFAPRVRHLWIMGGVFWQETAEHNIKCDPEAADVVFRSPIPITVCGLDVTRQVWFREPEVAAIAASCGELGPVLEDQIRRWWAFSKSDRNNPHDPLALLPMVRPELFRFEHCDVAVGLGADDLARTTPTGCGAGRVRIAADVRAAAAEAEMVRRITA
ncbi:MAG: nucleoside hydrolase [Chloroflexota bacterium]|nr:nucleoside hydrolase [Chloroflexota bacterium]